MIDGSTKLLAIVGDPIAQVRSPGVLNARLAQTGQNTVLVPMQVTADRFETTLRALMEIGNIDGFLFTIPHKQRAFALADNVGPDARVIGAINALRREPGGFWTGDMFDGKGLIAAVEGLGREIAGQRVLLIGAGGAGRAISFEIAREGARELRIFDADQQRTDQLATAVQTAYPACKTFAAQPDVTKCDVLINATPVGMKPEYRSLPLIGDLTSHVTVIDMVTEPAVTPLLAMAARVGCARAGGIEVVKGQAEAAIAFFRKGG